MGDLFPKLHQHNQMNENDEFYGFDTFDTEFKFDSCCENKANQIIDEHSIICIICGNLIDTPLEEGAEYRWFTSESTGVNPTRCGFPLNSLLPESSFGTLILTKSSSKKMRKITLNHTWSIMPSRERTLWKIFEDLKIILMNAGINTAILEESKFLYAQIIASSPCRGKNQRTSLLAACVWEAFRRHDSPRLPYDLGIIFNISVKLINNAIRNIQQVLSHRKSGDDTRTYTSMGSKATATVSAEPSGKGPLIDFALQRKSIGQSSIIHKVLFENFIQPFIQSLSIPRKISSQLEEFAIKICYKVDALGIVPEKTPPSLAAAVLYFCSRYLHHQLDIKEISLISHVSVITLQKCVKRLESVKEKLIYD